MRQVLMIYHLFQIIQLGRQELTLITCNNSNNKRLIIKAKKEGNN